MWINQYKTKENIHLRTILEISHFSRFAVFWHKTRTLGQKVRTGSVKKKFVETNRSGSFVYSQVAFTFASDVFTTPRVPTDAWNHQGYFFSKEHFSLEWPFWVPSPCVLCILHIFKSDRTWRTHVVVWFIAIQKFLWSKLLGYTA